MRSGLITTIQAAAISVVVTVTLLAAPAEASHRTRVTALQTDAATKALGVDDPTPRLNWRLATSRRGARQTAYRVVIRRGRQVVWDTHKVAKATPWVDYGGPKLASRARYTWAVTLWDERGRRTQAAKSWFETAFMDPSEWSADWISGPPMPANCSEQRQCMPAPLLRTEFLADKPVASARLYASGLGYGTYFLNGARVGDQLLSPGFTEYNERAFYVTRDVTRMIHRGRNAIGAELGRGPFGQTGANFSNYQSAPWHAEPTLRLELHITYKDGSTTAILSGPHWKTTDGPIRFDDYMLGETYDARRADALGGWAKPGFDDAKWVAARKSTGPTGRLVAEQGPPIRAERRRLAFREVKDLGDNTYLFDLGRNIAGNAVLDADLPAGQTITLHYGEKLDASGHVDTSGGSSGGNDVFQLDTYTAHDGPDHWRPEFTYNGFQYVEVTGLKSKPELSMLHAQRWHADLPAVGHWTSSVPLLNRILAVSENSMLANTYSQPTDTPVYEKTGYTGDGQLVAGAMSYLFDMRRFYTKWTTDIRQSVEPNGDMPIIAPSPDAAPPQSNPFGAVLGFHGPSPGWDVALFDVPDYVRQFGGDERPQVQSLPEMKSVMAYYDTQAVDGLLMGHCAPPINQPCYNGLGDWTYPTNSYAGVSVDSNSWWAEMLRIESESATLAGDAPTAGAAEQRRANLIDAFNQRFTDPTTGTYHDPATPAGTYQQHENAMPLALGLVPQERRQAVGDALAADVKSHGEHLTTGIMGTRFLFDALSSTGHIDDALAVATQKTYPSYGHWIDDLHWTGLGENWEDTTRSRNHQMYGSIVQWFFADLAGITPTKPGFQETTFRPMVPSEGLNHVAATVDSVRGRVGIDWTRTTNGLKLVVTVPPNGTGVVEVPVAQRSAVKQPSGATFVGVRGGRVIYHVPAGTYRFLST